MNFKLLIVVLLIMSSTFIWAGYEIELVSETTFQNNSYGSVNLTEYNGKLYFAVQGDDYGTIYCVDDTGLYELPQFPADGRINGAPLIVYDGKLYCRFCYNSNINIGYLGCFDGTTFSVIENLSPDHYGINSLDKAVVYDGKLYLSYIEDSNGRYLASFDGSVITTIEEYDSYNYDNRLVFNNKLYYLIENKNLRCFDGTTTITIPHPTGGDYPKFNEVVIHNDKLYTKYLLENGNYSLAVLVGDSMQLLTDPYCAGTGMRDNLILCNDKIYYLSRNIENSYDEEVSCYNTLTEQFEDIQISVDFDEIISLNVLNNQIYCFVKHDNNTNEFLTMSENSFISIGESAISNLLTYGSDLVDFSSKLFFSNYIIDWELYQSTPYFSWFDGTNIENVELPEGLNSKALPLSVHADKLYLIIMDDSSRLDYDYYMAVCQEVEDDPLPVTLSSFNCSLSGDSPLLQWVTLSETANAGWNVYRGLNNVFSEGFKVNTSLISGQGTTTETTNYSFLDEFPVDKGTNYYYWLESIGQSGQSDNFGPLELFIPQDEENIPELPDTSLLRQNIPNPFNPTTTIAYDIAYSGDMELSIYNAKGQLVETLYKGYREAGYYSTTWQADQIASGIYYVKLSSVGYVKSRKMLLLK